MNSRCCGGKYSLSSHLIVTWWNAIAQLFCFYSNVHYAFNIFDCSTPITRSKKEKRAWNKPIGIMQIFIHKRIFCTYFSAGNKLLFRDCFYYLSQNKVQFWCPDIRLERHGTLMHGLSNGERISRLHISKTSVSTPSSVSCIDWLMALFVECASLDVSPFWPPRCICVCVWSIEGHWGLTDGHLSALFAFTPKVRGGQKKSEGNKFNPDRAKVTHSVTPTKPNQYSPYTILFLIFWAGLFSYS